MNRFPQSGQRVGGARPADRITRMPKRGVELERISHWLILEDRHSDFAKQLVDAVMARCRRRRNVRPEPGRNDGIGIERGALVAMLEADGDADRSGGQLEQVAGQVGGEAEDLLLAFVALGERDIVEHCRRDRACPAEQVERNAARGRGARGERPDGKCHPVGAHVAGEGLPRLVDAVEAVDVPEPVAAEQRHLAVERRGERRRVHLLGEGPLPGLDQTARDERIVRCASVERAIRIEPGFERHAERVERVGNVKRQGVEQASGPIARVGSDEQWFERRLILRVAAVVAAVHSKMHGFADVGLQAGPRTVTLARRQDVLERREVEPVGIGERPQFAEGRGIVGRRADRLAATEGQEATVDRRAAATAGRNVARRLAGVRELGDIAIGRTHRLLLHIGRACGDAERAVSAIAPARLIILGLAVMLTEILAILRRQAKALLSRHRDYVDHAGDRVGAVKR